MKENNIITAEDRASFDALMSKQLKSISNSTLSKALTATVFRNGPVEDMHSDGKLSDDDMKTLNKYMVNQFNYLMELYQKGEHHKLMTILSFGAITSSDWDEPEKIVEYDNVDFKKMEEQDILSSKQKGLLNAKGKDIAEQLSKKCIVIDCEKLEDIIGEITGYIPSFYKNEDGEIYVEEFCDQDLNVCNPDIDVVEVIEVYFGITIQSIHGVWNEENEELSIWIEY